MCKVAPGLPTPRRPGSWDGDGSRECAPCPMRARRGAAAAGVIVLQLCAPGRGGRATWRGRRMRGPRAPGSRSGRPLNETLRSPGQGCGGRPRGTQLCGGPSRPRSGVIGASPPPGGAQPGARVWRGSAGGRESPFVCAGKVRPRELRLRLRAGGAGGEHLLRVNAGRGGSGGLGSRTERRWHPSFKGLPGRGNWMWGGWFPGPRPTPPKGRRPVPPYSQSGSGHLLSSP